MPCLRLPVPFVPLPPGAPGHAAPLHPGDRLDLGGPSGWLGPSRAGRRPVRLQHVAALRGATGRPVRLGLLDLAQNTGLEPLFPDRREGPLDLVAAFLDPPPEDRGALVVESVTLAAPRDITRASAGAARGTRVATRGGYVPIERIGPDHEVLTQAHGYRKPVMSRALAGGTAVRLSAGGLPLDAALEVTAATAVVLSGWRSEALFGREKALVPALCLLDGRDVRRAQAPAEGYWQIGFATDEIVYLEGFPVLMPRGGRMVRAAPGLPPLITPREAAGLLGRAPLGLLKLAAAGVRPWGRDGPGALRAT